MEYNYNEEHQSDGLLFEQIKANPNKAYQTILKNKLSTLKQKQAGSSDFNIKPVPK